MTRRPASRHVSGVMARLAPVIGLAALIALAAFMVSLAGCAADSQAASKQGLRPGTHWIVAADLSASRQPTQLQEGQDFVKGLTRVVRNGDAVTLFRVYERGFADTNFIWTSEISAARDPDKPRPSDSLALIDFADELTAEVTVLFNPSKAGKLQGTDLFTTLHRAAELAAADPRRRHVLIIVSDMLQSTRDVDMERNLPDTTWIRRAANDRILPNLSGVCAVVIGADVATARGKHVQAFWEQYFRLAGGDLRGSNYRNFAPSPEGMSCS
ncbi:MAG TPA: hypothetical protein VFT29_03065 [Gemmatimonadaceae bacterium]|nr:hypothetical protein [Gemmatimonadaceae bacterium]